MVQRRTGINSRISFGRMWWTWAPYNQWTVLTCLFKLLYKHLHYYHLQTGEGLSWHRNRGPRTSLWSDNSDWISPHRELPRNHCTKGLYIIHIRTYTECTATYTLYIFFSPSTCNMNRSIQPQLSFTASNECSLPPKLLQNITSKKLSVRAHHIACTGKALAPSWSLNRYSIEQPRW